MVITHSLSANCTWWSWPVWIWIGCRLTSSCGVLHWMMSNCENDSVFTVWYSWVCVCVCITLDLSLTERTCCRPEESCAFSLSVRNSVSMESSLETDTHDIHTINQHPSLARGTHITLYTDNSHHPSLITAAESNIEILTQPSDLWLWSRMQWHQASPPHLHSNPAAFFFVFFFF